MRNFWLRLWSYWALWITLFSVVSGLLIAIAVTVLIYFYKGSAGLNSDVLGALADVVRFWFAPAWSIGLVVGMLLSLKRLFYRCTGGQQLLLYSCDGSELIRPVHVEDTLKLWRKWLFVTVWIIALAVLAGAGIAYLSVGEESMMAWFSIYWLYLFFLLSALITLPMMAKRCKMVKVGAC